jgi:hypothetical protein
LYPASDVRPKHAPDVFEAVDSPAGEARFEVGPVVFRIPERASSNNASMYVVLSGRIAFADPCEHDKRSTTLSFATRVGYFRATASELDHVYGAHYDMEETILGHPVFHAQLTSQADFCTEINRQFNTNFEVGRDQAKHLLGTVRLPIAQMDVFSVITQIGADHLLSSTSGHELREAFKELRAACDFFIGAANRLDYLSSAPARYCYRSTHWYGSP